MANILSLGQSNNNDGYAPLNELGSRYNTNVEYDPSSMRYVLNLIGSISSDFNRIKDRPSTKISDRRNEPRFYNSLRYLAQPLSDLYNGLFISQNNNPPKSVDDAILRVALDSYAKKYKPNALTGAVEEYFKGNPDIITYFDAQTGLNVFNPNLTNKRDFGY